METIKRTADPAPLKVYTFRGIGNLSHEAFEIFRRTLFEKEPLTAADRELLEKEKVWSQYEWLKAAPRWVQHANLFTGIHQRSSLIPESELDKANAAILTEIPALMKRERVGDLIYKAHYYGEKLFLTPGDHARLKNAGVTESDLLEMAKAYEGRKFSDYDEMRKEWETELSAKRKHLLKTYAMAPLHLARMLLLIPDVITNHKTNRMRDRLLEDPDHEFTKPATLLDRAKGLAHLSDSPYFDEKAFAEKLENLRELRAEIKANPEKYKNAAQLQAGLRTAMRILVMAAVLSMKFGYDDDTLENSLNVDGPNGMHREDADNGIVELIYFPDARDAAIRIGPKIYHYDYNSMVRVDSIPAYGTRAINLGDHVRIRLKVSPEEVKALIEKLESERNRNFMGVAPYNTAMGKANQDLKAATGFGVPSVFDRTHATALPLLKARSAMESLGIAQDRIEKIIYASNEKKGRSVPGLVTDGLEATYVSSLPWKSAVILPLVERLPKGPRDESEIVKRVPKSKEQYIEELKAAAAKVKTWDQHEEFLETYPGRAPLLILNDIFDMDEADRLDAEAEAKK